FGKGVIVNTDGSASGTFYNVLDGSTALGAQTITVNGLVTSGAYNANGSVTYSGSATLDMGDGTPPTSLPFVVTATPQGLTLAIGTTTLPTQSITSGSIDFN